ncbi:MAG: asparagine synthase, glutamine-hydrolyzing, partial [Bacteroidetes bacterium]|nr:asparagine synthase, glutamine-hydrolyzing [Bacteroidota bacterium]
KRNSISGNKIAELLSEPQITFRSAYPLVRSVFTKQELSKLVKEQNPLASIEKILSEIPQKKDHLFSAVSIAEITTYLQNVLLRDTDQMSMAVALEVREPFLDHKLVEFVLNLKDEHKYPHTPKKLLTDSLGDLLPPEIIHRQKMGFTLPWAHWLKNELKTFCEKNLFELAGMDFCNGAEIKDLWGRYLNNDPTVSWSRIWHLVILNNWLKQNKVSE